MRQNYGPRYVPHETWTSQNLWPFGNIRDPAAVWWQWEPSTQLFKQAIRDREWPLWEPYIAGGGTPAMANLVPAFFFPPYVIVVMLGASVALLNGYFLLLVWAPAFFTFLFVRRHDVGFWPSMTAAVAVMLGGMVHQHTGTFLGQTMACFPLVMYVTRRYFDWPTARRAALLAVVYASTALTTFAPALLVMFSIAALYGVVVLATESVESRPRTIAIWIAGLAISMGLVAFQYLPALALRAATPQMASLLPGRRPAHHAGAESLSDPVADVDGRNRDLHHLASAPDVRGTSPTSASGRSPSRSWRAPSGTFAGERCS